MNEFVVLVKVKNGLFHGWQGFAAGWILLEKKTKPKFSRAIVNPVIGAKKFLSVETAEIFAKIFSSKSYTVKVISLDEAEEIASAISSSNDKIGQ